MADTPKTIRLNLDPKGVLYTGRRGLSIDLYAPDTEHPYQGLYIDAEGRLMAQRGRKGEDGDGEVNLPGNGIGNPGMSPSPTNTDLHLISANETVSRHQQYSGDDDEIKSHDGVVMTKVDGEGHILGGCLAYEILTRVGGL